jgi:nickel-dependent lactate racemase
MLKENKVYREIVIPYGHETKKLHIPVENLAWVEGPKCSLPIADLVKAVREAIRAPIGSQTLPELVARYGKKTVILVDDGTRSTPQSLILHTLLGELNAAGIGDREIKVLIALGTHRPMTQDEIVARFGAEAVKRVLVKNMSQDYRDFLNLGVTPSGVPIYISKEYLESEMSIAVGNIIPHMYAGWAGGAKMVQPGVSSGLTTSKTHLIAGPRVYEILGQVDNPVRREMEEIAVKSGLKFIVNVVLNREGGVIAVVAGDVIAAHRAGVEIARPIYTIPLKERVDIVIAGSHPADRDLWQGFKPINNCGMMVKDGGTLILVIPAPEGIAPDHPQLVDLGVTPSFTVIEMVERGDISDGVAAATYLALDRTRSRVNIILVTDGISNEEASKIGLKATRDFEEALRMALDHNGKKAQIGVITHGADIMAHFELRPTTGQGSRIDGSGAVHPSSGIYRGSR